MNSEKGIVITDELIAKYLSGEATPEEALALTDWRQHPANQAHFEKFELTWHAITKIEKPKFNSAKAWNTLGPEKKSSTRFLGMTSQMLRIAASVMVVAVCGALLYLRLKETPNNTLTTQNETSVLNLADQSKVTLYHQTTIDYPVEFSTRERKVSLMKGEAFFEVAPDKQKPFIVHTATADIQVVGTKFNVVVNGDQTEISVEEGKVLVYTASDSVFLTKGFASIVRNGSDQISINNITSANRWGYATQKLAFKNTPLEIVIQDIQKTFPCKVTVTNQQVKKCKVTATFDKHSAEKIINLVADILSLTIKKDGDVYILEGEGCP